MFTARYRDAWSAAHPGRFLAVCDMCGHHVNAGEACYAKRDLKNHVAAHDVGQGEAFPCGVPGCGKSFTQASDLKRHAVVHDPSLRMPCPDCGAMFTQAVDLKRHAVVHDPSLRVPCPACGAMFTDQSQLAQHAAADENPLTILPHIAPPKPAHPETTAPGEARQ